MRPQLVDSVLDPRDAPEPLGPDSLIWKHFGDWRGVLLTLYAGSMQNMHPQLGAGVEEHSRFFDERWERLYRSLYPIGGVVYDGPRARETALEVRGYHNTIKGIDKHGRPYSALNPETWTWAHATFVMSTILSAQALGSGLSYAEKEQIWEEGKQWYRLYGVTDRELPDTLADFEAYYDRMCRTVLEDNKATRDVLDIKRIGKPPALPWMPEAMWRVVRIPVTRGFVWLTVGLYPQPVRELLGYRWNRVDQLAFRIVGRSISAMWSVVPFERRYHPRARAGWQRERTGRIEPLVETPARNLPPLHERDKPTHYSPSV